MLDTSLVLDVVKDVANLVHVLERCLLVDLGQHAEEALGQVEQGMHDAIAEQPLGEGANQVEHIEQLLFVLDQWLKPATSCVPF